ncbi:MAG TPA: urease accessory UreF family protein [Hypericibacter adhaerens]|jgi:urease accessory protein|uniref:Urease accessory protein UreF n=1 Tax=Hypericibacter adhaerens TaxID=2602016 RepID=A0A5J6N0S3_9PROT|nr:urease accessory UreF family protein [Hypericibacter adhaerens]QEX22854.1 urease accessory protein UreF [Hypericibacter adhaerens]HWA42059.1 urease accessory UreF family protein [Hypericibacter adhaerens]
MTDRALYRLLAWLSPSYPVGAFSYSHGLEWAIEAHDLRAPEPVLDWIGDLLRFGAGRSDAILFAHAFRAVAAGDEPGLAEITGLARAFQPSRERALESLSQGEAFLRATRAAWPAPALDWLKAVDEGEIAYPVAVAVAASAHGVALAPALQAYLQSFAANLVSAAVRLIPLGQTAGLRLMAALEPVIGAVAEEALTAPLETIGGCALRADLASMNHEIQETRLFRT